MINVRKENQQNFRKKEKQMLKYILSSFKTLNNKYLTVNYFLFLYHQLFNALTLQQFVQELKMTIKMEQKGTKSFLKLNITNRRKLYRNRFRTCNTKKHLPSELNKMVKKTQAYDKFRIRIRKNKQIRKSDQKFRVKIPATNMINSQFRFFRLKIKEFVEDGREDSKNYFIDQTNESQLNSHGSLQSSSLLKYKVINDMKLNKFREFLKFRNQCFSLGNKIKKNNISCCSLFELIEILFNKKLIVLSVYNRFLMNYSQNLENTILENIQDNVETINFKNCLFFLIDHRIFTKVIVNKFPEEYELVTSATTFSHAANQYLKKIYDLQETQYNEQFNEFNRKYERFWMPVAEDILSGNRISLNFEERIEQFQRMNSFGRILRKRN